MESFGQSFGTRALRFVRNLLLLSAFVSIAAVAVYALSLVNSRTYTLEIHGNQLVIHKGRMFPTGSEPWIPSDSTLADAYAAIDLDGNNTLPAIGRSFGERDELDRSLFTVLEALAAPRVASGKDADLEKAFAYVRRAGRLPGITAEQKARLAKLQTDLAFFLARLRLDESRRQLEEALMQLKLAAESDSRHRTEAGMMLLAVEPQVKLLSATLRATALPMEGGNWMKVLEPRLKDMFESLQKAAKSDDPPSEAAPEPTP